MKTKSEKMLPKTADEILNGGVYAQAVRCGKKNCRCSHGDTHTAFYFFTRRNGKLLKFYIRKSEVESFTRLVELSALRRKTQREILKESFGTFKKLAAALLERQSFINSLKER